MKNKEGHSQFVFVPLFHEADPQPDDQNETFGACEQNASTRRHISNQFSVAVQRNYITFYTFMSKYV